MTHPIKIHNLSRPQIQPIQGKYCDTFLCRLKGYTFRKELQTDEGIVLVEPRDARYETAIHMLFVWTDLAVFWINSNYEVADRVLARAWHPIYVPAKAGRYILEIHPSRLDDFRIGETVKFDHE